MTANKYALFPLSIGRDQTLKETFYYHITNDVQNILKFPISSNNHDNRIS